MAYNTSSGYKTVIYSGDSNNKLLLKFNNVELENADIYCEKVTVKSSILPNGSNRFSLENFISKEVEIVLHDVDINSIVDQVYIAIGTFVGSAYEYVPIGIFNIQDKPITDGNKITITLRDNAVKFDFNYNAQPLFDLHGGTATKLQILQDMCIIAGVECDITSFLGSTDLIGIYDSSIKARKYVSYLAGQAGMIPTIDRDGKLIFIDIKNLTTKVIPLNIVEKYENGIPYKISKTIYESGIIKYESGTTDNDVLYLDSANPYITTQEQVDSIHSLVNGFEIDSFKTGKILGDPSIDSYDLISIIDGENTYTTLATNTLVYQKSMIQTFDTQISLEARETNVSINSDATFKKYAKTNIDNINAQIEIIAGEVIDLSANVNGLGNVILTNCSKTPLYKIVIKNACQLFPSVNLFPSSTTFLKNRYLRITHEDNTYERYLLPILSLRTYNGVSDELIVENNKLSIIKRVGVNVDESFYVLTTPITTTYDDIFLYLNEGTNTIWLEGFPNATLEVTYLLKNKYTNVFATQADVSSQITVSSEQINLEVAKKVNADEAISSINLSPETIVISSSKIDIDGVLEVLGDSGSTTINGDNVTTGTLDASIINVTNLNASNIKTGSLQSTNYVLNTSGTKINLSDGTIDTKNFKVDATGNMICNNAEINSVNMTGGSINGSILNLEDDGGSGDASININNSSNSRNVLISSDYFHIAGGGHIIYISTNDVFYEDPTTAIMDIDGKFSVLSGGGISSAEGLFAVDSSGNVTCVSLTQTSKEEMKKNFEKFDNALDIIDNIDIYKYHFKEQDDKDKKHIGFVIGDKYKYSEEITSNNNDGVDLYSMVSVCMKAIKEQQEQIDKLNNEILLLKESDK